MLLSHLPQRFDELAGRADLGERPQAAALTFPAPYAPRALAVSPVLEVAVTETSDNLIVRVKGEARVEFAGALADALLTAAARRLAVITLDLSQLHFISSLAMGVLVSYRRGVIRRGSRGRLAEQLQPEVKEALARAKLLDLFETTAHAAAA